MTQALGTPSSAQEAWVRFQASSCAINGAKSGTGEDLSHSTCVHPCQRHPPEVPQTLHSSATVAICKLNS
jgi:hypothetical protein